MARFEITTDNYFNAQHFGQKELQEIKSQRTLAIRIAWATGSKLFGSFSPLRNAFCVPSLWPQIILRSRLDDGGEACYKRTDSTERLSVKPSHFGSGLN
jgi:hypothetical protein